MGIVVGCSSGNHRSFDLSWQIITRPEEYSKIDDRAYFIRWHWKIPASVYGNFQCVGFHCTDLPYGRGGDPIGNLLARGFKETMVTAFIMEEGWDTGDVVMKRPLALCKDRETIIDDLYFTCSRMIRYIEQSGFPMRIPQSEYGTTKFRRMS